MHEVAELEGSIKLARVYFRVPAQSHLVGHLVPGDFARRRMAGTGTWREPGISLWRLDRVSAKEAIDRVPSRKQKGLAVVDVGSLQQMGYRFVITDDNLAHVSLRCRLCDLALNMEGFCVAATGDCGFDDLANFEELVTLANTFRIILPTG